MPLLNFGVIIGLSLLLLVWYLHAQAAKDKTESESKLVEKTCPENAIVYKIHDGDSCWSIADSHSVNLADVEALNPDLDCSKLPVGIDVCIPETSSPI